MCDETNQPQLSVARKAALLDVLLVQMRTDSAAVLWNCRESLSADELVSRLRATEATQKASVVIDAVENHLQKACEFAEAGFHFEEGGCFGMALALHELFKNAGLAPELAFSSRVWHATVVVGGKHYDYRGETRALPDARIVSQDQLLAEAFGSDYTPGHVESDKAYAESAIKGALELAAEALAVEGAVA